MSDYKIGILTIGYNRANNLLRLLNSINAATFPTDDVDLLISIDNSGTKDVENAANSFKWLHGRKKIYTYPERLGLRKHILKCGDFYESPEEICLKDLPNQFAMKLNVGCRCNLVCKDKNELDEEQVIETARKWFKQDYYKRFAEMQYKDVKPCIIVEKYLGTESGELPVDYKFYCMNGKASSVMVCVDRKDGQHPKFFFLDREWNKLPYTKERFLYPDLVIEKPKMIDQAFDLAEKLSKNFPFVRVDLYIIGEKIYFGELTFTPAAGLDSDFKFVPPGGKEDADTMLGKLLTLPKN